LAKFRVEDAGYTTRGPTDWVVLNVFAELAAHADQLFGLEDLEYQLARLRYQLVRLDNGDGVVVEGTYPALVDTVLARYTLGDLTRVLRAMISEGLSIHNLPSILERLLEYDTVSSDPTAVVLDDRLPLVPGTHDGWQATYASLRRGLRSYISHRFSRAENTVVAYLLEPELEARLASGIQRTHGIPTHPLPDEEAEAFRDAVWHELSLAGNSQAGRPVILTTEGVRASVRRLLEPELPDLPVLSYAELRPDVNVQPLARIPIE
jgi:type III secretion protein V